jgi:hypothetical protein
VLLKWKMGPVAPHTITRPRADRNAWGFPVARAVAFEQTVKKGFAVFIGLIRGFYRSFRGHAVSKVRMDRPGAPGYCRVHEY